MIVSKTASAVYNDVVSGMSGYEANLNMSLQQLEDECVEEFLQVIKEYSLKNIIPLKDLAYTLSCLDVDCARLEKCCDLDGYSTPVAHTEIPQIVNDFGELSVLYFGSIDKQVPFKVYTSPTSFRYQKYKMHRKNKPFVYIDTTPNSNNRYDCYLFNVPLLEKVSITAVFKDPRQVEEFSCCEMQDTDNMSFVTTEVKKRLIEKKLRYYRQLYQQPQPNTQVPA